jgi:hypothetical protein
MLQLVLDSAVPCQVELKRGGRPLGGLSFTISTCSIRYTSSYGYEVYVECNYKSVGRSHHFQTAQ